MREKEERKGDNIITCLVIHVSLLIVFHAGSKVRFLKGTEQAWKANSSTGDYHDEMNRGNFFKWVKEKLIPHCCLMPSSSSTMRHIIPPPQKKKKTSAQRMLRGRQTYMFG